MPRNVECKEFACALSSTCIMYPYGAEACKNCYSIKCEICHMKYTCQKGKENIKEYKRKLKNEANWWNEEEII